MATSVNFLLSSVFVALAFFLVRESYSFHLPEGRPRSSPRRPHHLLAVNPLRLSENSLNDNKRHYPNKRSESESSERRTFLADILSKVSVAAVAGVVSSSLAPTTAALAATDVIATGIIKVTPIAHTFVIKGGSAPKPVRENDATRFFTNARVVYLFDGNPIENNLAQEVTDLTTKRKAERGPGVTPGDVQILTMTTQLNVEKIAETAKQMPEGDVLLVGPIPSRGTATDGKILADTASTLGTFVGGKSGGGVISVLLDGPKENLKLNESGFPASELLWYSLPSRK